MTPFEVLYEQYIVAVCAYLSKSLKVWNSISLKVKQKSSLETYINGVLQQSFKFQSNFQKCVYLYTSCGFSYIDAISTLRLFHQILRDLLIFVLLVLFSIVYFIDTTL